MFENLRSRHAFAGILSAVALLAMPAERALAATTTYDLFIIADQTVNGDGTATTTSVYELEGMFTNINRVATSISSSNDFTYDLGTGLDVEGFNRGRLLGGYEPPLLIDEGEIDTLTNAYLEAESQTLDGGANYDQRIDFGRNTSVIFDLGTTGITDFIIADLGAYNDFTLRLCDVSDCSGTNELLFRGLTSNTRDALVATGEFGVGSGVTAIDQVLYFSFDAPVTGYLQVVENDSRGLSGAFAGSARLQADYVGGVSLAEPPSEVPLPSGLPLMAGGFGLLLWLRRRAA